MTLESTGSFACDTDPFINTQAILSQQVSRSMAASGPDDMALLQRIRNADQAAMAELFDRYSRTVFSVAVHILKDDAQAEDVMQEIFFRLWQNSDSFVQARGSMRGWLMAVARNRSIDVVRRRKPTDPVEEVFLASRSNQVAEVEHNSLIARVYKAMDKLPQEQQKSMKMAFFDELTHVEIAERTGEPLGTVKTRIRLALITLRKALAS